MVTFGTRFTRSLLIVSILGLSAGCAGLENSVQSAVSGIRSATFGPQDTPEPQAAPTYCYRTLGKVNCYSQPLPASEANRLVGYEGPAPRASSGSGPLSP